MKNENSGGNLKVCFIGTYPPRKCGIATFTSDLNKTVWETHEGIQTNVIAITGAEATRSRSPEVFFEIRQNQLRDYRLAAEYINFSGVDVVSLQHEFGIFGGQNGRYVIDLVERLRRPVVTTLHTVPQKPEPELRTAIDRIARASQYLVVLSDKAIQILRDVYGIAEEKVKLIHHGVPDVSFVDPNYYKDKFGVEGRMVLLTFGLLSRNKGIEFMLEALPDIVREHPEVVYLVLGATHPEVKKRDGEEYRLMLLRKVRELGLQDNVIFYDRFVDFEELCEFIGACDIYVTPYRSADQIASGTLAFAVGTGKAVVSTPYLYAEEVLAAGRGKLVKFSDAGELSQAVIELIEKEAIRHRMRKRAYEYGRRMIWPEVARQYVDLFRKATRHYQHGKRLRTGLSASPDIPEIKLDHLVRMTDDTGIMQHSIYGIPDRRHGYSTDDVARALIVSLMH
ncbi:MAG TPA: glycosyltransferase family 4 protein, partial [Pyrinomonadaceae bacterium]|nr:glycosyltransferase family 4 protein [Pyrinomonadaceae bacterium]